MSYLFRLRLTSQCGIFQAPDHSHRSRYFVDRQVPRIKLGVFLAELGWNHISSAATNEASRCMSIPSARQSATSSMLSIKNVDAIGIIAS
jgi:hypothetical protein